MSIINNYSYYTWKMANCFDSDEGENSRSRFLPWIYIHSHTLPFYYLLLVIVICTYIVRMYLCTKIRSTHLHASMHTVYVV